MSIFRTELTPAPSSYKINHKTRLFTIGSCFADTLGSTLDENKFETRINPYGTVYNPVSIHSLLKNTIDQSYPPESSYVKTRESFFNFLFHSSFYSTNSGELSTQLKLAIDKSHDFIQNANVVIITYGTAWVYERTDSKEIVANCHKLPSANFQKRLLTVDEIVNSFQVLFSSFTKNTQVGKIILTVSPVRHLKETLELNSVSKSILRAACHLIVERFDTVDYFPSYEIMLDDLRDYRFYEEDMIHPSRAAQEYIWEKFSRVYVEPATLETVKRWQEVRKALTHRPFRPWSNSHKAFLQSTLTRLEELKHLIPVDIEINQIKSQVELMPDTK